MRQKSLQIQRTSAKAVSNCEFIKRPDILMLYN